jgi:hypothetical protein
MRALACLLSLFVAACAASPNTANGPIGGVAGPVTWEVTDIGRIVSEDNQRIRWSYLITLRNTSDRVIQLERMERAAAGSAPESIGGMRRQLSGHRYRGQPRRHPRATLDAGALQPAPLSGAAHLGRAE